MLPELLEALRRRGWRNFSLFPRENGLLFGYVEAEESFEKCLEGMHTESAGIVDVAVKGVDAKRHQDQGNSPKCDASRGALILTEWRRHAEDRFLA